VSNKLNIRIAKITLRWLDCKSCLSNAPEKLFKLMQLTDPVVGKRENVINKVDFKLENDTGTGA